MKHLGSKETQRALMFGLVDFGWFYYDELSNNPYVDKHEDVCLTFSLLFTSIIAITLVLI